MGNCVDYVWTNDPTEDRKDNSPVQCPVCKGFLKWTEERQPICNKCHTPLIAVAEADSSGDVEWGQVCVLKPLPDDVPNNKDEQLTDKELAENKEAWAKLQNNPKAEEKVH